MLQPITYSLSLNLAILIASGVLAWVFTNPLLFVIGLLVMQHVIQRFAQEEYEDEEPVGRAPMGFLPDSERG